MTNRNVLVIGGGVGPEAGTMFHQKIIKMTDNQGRGDQGHANVIHASFSQGVGDRTKFLLRPLAEVTPPNPGQQMAYVVNSAISGYSRLDGDFIVGVPCNTFHSEEIFTHFKGAIQAPRTHPLNMIELTSAYIGRRFEGKKIILLSTKGTKDTNVYSSQKFAGIITCGPEQQEKITDAIYNKEVGIKGNNPNYLHSANMFESIVREIVGDQRKEDFCVIMGCTEIPIAYDKLMRQAKPLKPEQEEKQPQAQAAVPAPIRPHVAATFLPPENYIDPMNILAANMVIAGGYVLKEEYDRFRIVSPVPAPSVGLLLSKL
ncbi:hypothetical protein GUA87_11715 [Sneathiella sp. P13V-1]|uniref:aspartate/glutamate racemase family protein n=1 Tax=Sneathiella sp. P13V-1 TaxID=2697366 RepID=UPI00187BB569|nr:aspartate/glutamate racemase family protein [Sneathiella sp. P13V-1]MBE7637514.1 hypothetical protein [Sneathiella sp. P13V-1]